MQYISTRNKNIKSTFSEAIIKGLAEDGGLFLPEELPDLISFFDSSHFNSIHDFSNKILKPFLCDFNEYEINEIVTSAFNFPIELRKIDKNTFMLELFHGPTLAFKDFGARFLAFSLKETAKNFDKKILILTATSGDTGSAVANAFYGLENIDAVILYPKDKISSLQEKQIATFDKNIRTLKVNGTFDDCQKLVKQCFQIDSINKKFQLTSANSINIGRLLPQMIYYIFAWLKLDKNKEINFVVPSGNFGNLTAGILASKTFMKVDKFIAAVNSNRTFYDYLLTGKLDSRASIQTISNAMDVGNPSNVERIRYLFDDDLKKISEMIKCETITDEETKLVMKNLFNKNGIIVDPHTAVGFSSLAKYREKLKDENISVVLSTAHPAKFYDIVKNVLNIEIDLPKQLKNVLEQPILSTEIEPDINTLTNFILS